MKYAPRISNLLVTENKMELAKELKQYAEVLFDYDPTTLEGEILLNKFRITPEEELGTLIQQTLAELKGK